MSIYGSKSFSGLLILAAGVFYACQNSRPVDSAAQKKPATDADGNDDDPEGLGSDTDGTDGAGGEFGGCGFSDFSAKTAFPVQKINSADLRFTGTAGSIFTTEYNVTVASTIGYSGDLAELKVSNAMRILNASPAKAQTEAQVEINKLTGSQTIEVLSPKKWEENAKANDWDGIFCSVIPALKITEQTEAHFSEIEFSPPVPYLVSPLLNKSRFEKEIGSEKVFNDVEAHVVSTSNPKLSNGQKLQGSVTISSVNANTTYNSSEGTSRAISADYAYRMEFNFGDGSTQIGLNKAATYYVKKGKFVAVIVETGEQKAPFIQFHVDE